MFGIEMSLFMYAALFVGVLLVVEGAYQLTVDARYGPRAVVNRRMRMIEAGADHSQILKALRREPRDLEGRARWLSGIALVERRLAQAGLAVPIHRLLLWVVALTLVGLISLRLFTIVPLPLALLASTGLALAVPALYVEWRRRRRVRQFGEQLPAALDLLVRSLRVGHPLSAALNIVA